jgi:hypothetical protein
MADAITRPFSGAHRQAGLCKWEVGKKSAMTPPARGIDPMPEASQKVADG